MDRAPDIDFRAESRTLAPELQAVRRDLHRHPELGGKETRTAALIEERPRRLGLEVRTGVAGTGVVGVLHARAKAPAIALRADIDARGRAPATGDDVVFFHREMPGIYWQLGSCDPARGYAHPLHSPRFDFDEELLALGAAVQARAAWELMAKEA